MATRAEVSDFKPGNTRIFLDGGGALPTKEGLSPSKHGSSEAALHIWF